MTLLYPAFFNRLLSARVPLAVPPLPWRVTSMSKRAMGGCFRAELVAEGDPVLLTMYQTLLRCGVELRDREGELVWWGYVHEVTIRWGGSESGASLEEMGNRVKARYSKLLPGQESATSTETAWEEDDYSIGEYGTKEKVLTIGSVTTDAAAEAARDRVLAAAALPVTVGDFATPDTSKRGVLVMVCYGWWRTLRWRLFGRDAGRLNYLVTGKQYQSIGQANYTNTTIGFEDTSEGDRIYDLSLGLGRYIEGMTITTSGATLPDNNDTRLIVDAPPGGAVLGFTLDVDDESPGASVTIAPYGTKAAQSFTTVEALSVGIIGIRARVVGNPTSDSLRVSIYSDSGGPDTSLGNATLSGVSIGSNTVWLLFALATPLVLAAATTYHVHIDRTGSNDSQNYYAVEFDELGGYGDGTFFCYDGSWKPRTGSIPFDLIEIKETTTVIEQILGAVGEFFTSVTIETESGVFTTITQLDDVQAISVIEDLLGVGTTNQRRLFATVNPDRSVVIYEEPDEEVRGYIRRSDGSVKDEYGAIVELARVMPGKWMAAEAVLQHAPVGSEMYGAARAMIDEVEFVPERDELRLVPRGVPSVWEL